MKSYRIFWIFIVGMLIITSCSTVPITGRRQLNFVPDTLIHSMSLQAYNEFLQENQVSDNQADKQQVQRVGQKIQTAVEKYCRENSISLEGYQWEFTLIESPEINAWAMPGGKVVVYSGLLSVAKTDAGLATVVGHEIAHVIAEHGSERMSQQLVRDMGGKAMERVLEEEPEKTRTLFKLAYGLGTEVGVLLRYSRIHETEADRMGLIFMAMAGYDPEEAIQFWQRMSKAKGGKGGATPEFLSTHPHDQTRIENLREFLPEAQFYYQKP